MNSRTRVPASRWARPVAVAIALAALPACGADDSASTVAPAARTYQAEQGLRTVAVNGTNMAYFEQGSGPLVILLHGFPDTAHTWDAVSPLLADAGFHAVAPFLSGYAPSSIPPVDPTLDVLGHQVLGLMHALGEDHAILVGHDWGAFAAYAAAAFDPMHIDKLVTIAMPHPSALAKHPELEPSRNFAELTQPGAVEMATHGDFRYLDELVARWSPTWRVPKGELEPVKNTFAAPGSLNAALGYYRAYGTRIPSELNAPLPMPALTFRGANDGAIREAAFDDQAAAFTGPFELVTFPVGHFVHREAEGDFVVKLLTFLRR